MYDVITYDRYKGIKDEFKIVHSECADQFIAAVLQWYQNDVRYPPTTFMGTELSLPPNIFNIIEYPNLSCDYVLNLFTESDINHLQEMFGFDKKTARNEAVKLHNNLKPERFDFMLHDIEAVLAGYNMFYCYLDDASFNPLFRNKFVKEVW